MKKLLLTLTIISSSVLVYAEKPNIDTDALINRGKLLGAEKLIDNLTISSKMKDEALKLYQQIEAKVKPRADEYAESITFDNETGVMKFDRVVSSKDKSKKDNVSDDKNYFSEKERVYIFISSSIPVTLLKRYAEDIDRFGLGRNAIFVIRGCVDSGRGVGGCEDFKPTLQFIKSFAYKKQDSIYNVQLWIDSLLFTKYQITAVPSFVYVPKVELIHGIGSEGKDGFVEASSKVYKSVGDWSVEYHINKLAEESNAISLNKIMRRYANEKDVQ